jgi:parallel beta-helix repeat protein
LRKTVSGILLFLLLVSTLTAAFKIQPAKAEPGTIIVPDDYPTIQEAINAANPEDTIYVRAGTYYENVVINKTVSLIGELKNETVIDANKAKSGIYITANNVIVRNFTIRNSGYEPWYTLEKFPNPYISVGIYIEFSNNVTVENNFVFNNGMGILLDGVNNSVLNDNIVMNNTDRGVWLSGSINCTLKNNNIFGNPFNFGVGADTLTEFIHNIDPSNMVDGKPIYYWVNQDNKEIPKDAGYVAVVNSTRIIIQDLTLSNNVHGVNIVHTSGSVIRNVTVTESDMGIYLRVGSKNNTIIHNRVMNNSFGIAKDVYACEEVSSDNVILENYIAYNYYGFTLVYGGGNRIYHNNLINNFVQVRNQYAIDTWDNGYPSGGNYWSDYTDVDLYSGPYQNETGSDGVWDHPYVIDANNQDRYPLVNPWTPTPTTPLPTEFWVEVRGTGSTLAIRKTPGSQNKPESDVLKRVPDGTRLQLVPDSDKVWAQKVEGDMWWHVKDVSDGTSGWAAGMYLFPIEDPFDSSFKLNVNNLIDEEKDNQENYFVEKWAGEKKISLALIMAFIQKESSFKEAGKDDITYGRFVYGKAIQRGDLFSKNFGITHYLNPKMDEYLAFGYMQLWFSAAYDGGFRTPNMENAQQNIENPIIAKEYYDEFNNTYFKVFGKSLPIKNNDYLAWFKGYFEWFKTWAVNRVISADKVEEKFFAYLDWPFSEWWDPDENIKYGTSVVQILHDRYKNWAVYNDPLHNVISAYSGGVPTTKNMAYVRDVMTYYKLYYFGFKDRSDIILKSPGELRVYDSQGRVTGLINGEIREEIPNSIYNNETNDVTIIFADESYTYEVFGTEEGTYELEVSSLKDGKTIIFNATSIPISANATHRYTVDWAALSQGEEGVTVQVDSDGDGVFEHTFTSGSQLTHDEFMLQTATTIDIHPDILNLKSKGRWVTAYIELPEGYNVSNIDVSSILLNGTIAVDPNAPLEIGDYDNDTVPDLMVKFNRTQVAEYILAKGIVLGNVTLTITGQLKDLTPFEGSDTIRVRMPGDVNMDGKVDGGDVILAARAFGSCPGYPSWNAVADENEDDRIDGTDIVLICRNFGKAYP